MDMGIVNAGQLGIYDEIPKDLLNIVEDVLLNRNHEATDRLVDFADTVKPGATKERKADLKWRNDPVQDRLAHSLVKGIAEFVEEDTEEARLQCDKSLEVNLPYIPAIHHTHQIR